MIGCLVVPEWWELRCVRLQGVERRFIGPPRDVHKTKDGGKHCLSEGRVRDGLDAYHGPITLEFPDGCFGGSGYSDAGYACVTFGARAGSSF